MPFLATALLATALAGPAQTLSFGDALLSHRPVQTAELESAANAAASNYFDADALISLGALALAVGGFAAAASLRSDKGKSVRGGEPVRRTRVSFNESQLSVASVWRVRREVTGM